MTGEGLLFVIDNLGREVAALRDENARLRAALAQVTPDQATTSDQ